jgi:hypothetical protein
VEIVSCREDEASMDSLLLRWESLLESLPFNVNINPVIHIEVDLS